MIVWYFSKYIGDRFRNAACSSRKKNHVNAPNIAHLIILYKYFEKMHLPVIWQFFFFNSRLSLGTYNRFDVNRTIVWIQAQYCENPARVLGPQSEASSPNSLLAPDRTCAKAPWWKGLLAFVFVHLLISKTQKGGDYTLLMIAVGGGEGKREK